MNEVHGVLVVDKPAGPTSHDLVSAARRLYGTRRVGHAGTLDPAATGVLVLLFGEATKLANYLTNADKSYRASVCLGRSTDTLDATGTTSEERAVPELSDDELASALTRERTRELQVPPSLSAIKVGGVRAHRATRRGAPPELAARGVHVARLELVGRAGTTLELELTVSKGYYVRALARDLGLTLGLPAHLSALRRTASGDFALAEALAWPPPAPAALLTLESAARRALPVGTLTADGERRAARGQPLGSEDFEEQPDPRAVSAWFSARGRLVALGEAREPGRFAVVRGFNAPTHPER